MANNLVLFSLSVFLVSFVSGCVPLMYSWSKRVIRLFVSYGAGVVLSVAFVHMLPEAFEISGHIAGVFLLAGFSLMYIMEKFLMLHPCDEHHCDYHYIGIAALCGFSIHSLISGISLGSSMGTSHLGWIVFSAVMIHKIPESFSLTSLLCAGEQYSKKTIVSLVFLFSLLVPIGTVIAYKFVLVDIKVTGYLVAIAAGTFIEIAACDILPELHRTGEWRYKNLAAFILGLLSLSLMDIFNHGH